METEEILDLEQSVSATPIYSQQAVRIFGILMSALFGGVLLYQNLKDIGKEKEANQVLLISFAFTAGLVLLGIFIPDIPSGASIGLNIGGGFILSNYMDKEMPGHKLMPKKKIWKPLIIALVILALFFGSIFIAVV